MSSGGNSGSQATSLITRAMALKEVQLSDWWRVAVRELPSGISLGAILGVIGVIRIVIWQHLGLYDYGKNGVPYQQVALTIFFALIGIVTFGSLAGSMLPFVLRRLGFDPASASAPFVATLVDVTGLVIYFTVALIVLGRFMAVNGMSPSVASFRREPDENDDGATDPDDRRHDLRALRARGPRAAGAHGRREGGRRPDRDRRRWNSTPRRRTSTTSKRRSPTKATPRSSPTDLAA